MARTDTRGGGTKSRARAPEVLPSYLATMIPEYTRLSQVAGHCHEVIGRNAKDAANLILKNIMAAEELESPFTTLTYEAECAYAAAHSAGISLYGAMRGKPRIRGRHKTRWRCRATFAKHWRNVIKSALRMRFLGNPGLLPLVSCALADTNKELQANLAHGLEASGRRWNATIDALPNEPWFDQPANSPYLHNKRGGEKNILETVNLKCEKYTLNELQHSAPMFKQTAAFCVDLKANCDILHR